ncbi:DUF565 domain-containing protein [Prochlorococcus sp. MIT 1341]|uniref:DUF565 domain-containing protein n=1 Tax=Prochlorococcus sp. MIT 1341 TaxID=3096221 RepID=UPI002A7541D0|nr:DUF565 domain-containing protein [Prochlorococcus sp. MIT 1341]
MNIQNTKLNYIQKKVWFFLTDSITGPWKKRSVGLLSLLIGYYLGSTLTSYYLIKFGERPLVGLMMVFVVELCVRARSSKVLRENSYLVTTIDNLRIGSVYSVVLEAFKLGS